MKLKACIVEAGGSTKKGLNLFKIFNACIVDAGGSAKSRSSKKEEKFILVLIFALLLVFRLLLFGRSSVGLDIYSVNLLRVILVIHLITISNLAPRPPSAVRPPFAVARA